MIGDSGVIISNITIDDSASMCTSLSLLTQDRSQGDPAYAGTAIGVSRSRMRILEEEASR
jgi:hypothetical protein